MATHALRHSGPRLHEFVPRHHRKLAVAGAIALFVGVAALWLAGAPSETRSPQLLPAAERRGLYEQTRDHAHAICQASLSRASLRPRCVDAAEFLATFPDCDADCVSFARRFEHQPAR
jgi:hypothetical protein